MPSVLWDFLRTLHQQIDETELTRAWTKSLRAPTLPPLLKESTIRTLPESPGVYIFYGQGGGTLYVGKSVNIRQRVLPIFRTTAHRERKRPSADRQQTYNPRYSR